MIILATIAIVAVSVFIINNEDNCCDKAECWKCPFPCDNCKNYK